MELEKTARDYLRSVGFTCEFYATDPIPEGLVTVKRTPRPGSTRFESRAMLTVQAWASTRGKAGARCCDAVDALTGRGAYEDNGGLMAADANITGCSPENGPYRWDDPDVKDRHRWQATVAVDYNS